MESVMESGVGLSSKDKEFFVDFKSLYGVPCADTTLSFVSDLVPQIQLVIKWWLVIHSNIDCAGPSAQADGADHLRPSGAPSVTAVMALGTGGHSTRSRGNELSATHACPPSQGATRKQCPHLVASLPRN